MDLAVLAADVDANSRELPCSFTIGGYTYENVSYNPGDMALPVEPGGILEGMGGPTVVITRRRFGTRTLPEEDDECVVRWQGVDYPLCVASITPGAVALIISLRGREE